MATAVNEIEAMTARFCAALGAGDLDGLMEYFGDDISLLSQGTPPIVGADAVRAYWAEVVAAGITGADATVTQVEEVGDVAIQHGVWTISITPPGGEPMQETGKYLVVHRRDDEGRWRAWFDMSQPDSPGTL